MSVDMYVGASKSQGVSAAKMAQSQIAAYEELQTAISQFTVNSDMLKGAAYDSEKSFFSAVLYPLSRGGILLSEAVAEACQKFPEEYVAQVDSGDLKESVLDEKIQEATRRIDELTELQERLRQLLYQPSEDGTLDGSLASRMAGNDELMREHLETKRELEKKKAKLLAFHGTSPSIFDDIAELQVAVELGVAQANGSWDGSTGRFVIDKTKMG